MNQDFAIPDPWSRPGPPAWALAEVRTRRVFALCVDLLIVGTLFLALLLVTGVLGFFTFGLTWLAAPILFPAIALIYNGSTVSGWRMATPGMRLFDLEARRGDGTRAPFVNAAAHALFFYLTWTFLTPFVLAVSFIARDKRCLHDFLADIVVTRRL